VGSRAEEIEAHYCKSPFVKEVCLIGHRAVVVANMELMRGRKIVNVGDLLRFELEGLSHLLPETQRLQAYEIWFDELPRTPSQTIDRDAVERRVRELQRIPQLPDPDANLEIDLGLDSLDRVELLAQLGLTVEQAAEIYTVRQLVAMLRSGFAQADRTAWATILRETPDLRWLLRRRIFAPLLWGLLRIVRTLFVRVRVNGLDNLPPSGPYIISPNHQSYVDPFILCSVLPYRVFRDTFHVGAVEYFETRFTRWVAHTANLVPVDPDSNLIPAMQAGAYGLRHGKILLVFPEGERSIDGTVKRFKKGAAILAQHLGVPVVPVALKGIYEVWPRMRDVNWRLVAPWSGHRVSIDIGQPMMFAPAADAGASAARLRARVNEMWEALST
jgi:long-chain acyl-CoA synthetase